MDRLPTHSISAADLETMNDRELADLEDRLLLHNELDSSKEARFTAGRAVVWVLMIIGMVTALSFYAMLLPTDKLGPLNIPLYLIALGLGAGAGHLVWAHAGRHVRGPIRLLLDYWPLALYLAGQLYLLSRRA